MPSICAVRLTVARGRSRIGNGKPVGEDLVGVVTPHSGAPLRGAIRVPSSKSITQRALVAAALAGSPSRIVRPLDAEDPRLLHDALNRAGFALRWQDDVIEAGGAVDPRGGNVLMGNNGTGTRFMLAQFAAIEGEWLLDGTSRLRERPVAPLVEALRRLGGAIEPVGRSGRLALPLRIVGRKLAGGEVKLDSTTSSQFASALLLLAPRLPGGLALTLEGLTPSRPYLDLTIAVLRAFGAALRVEESGCFAVAGSGFQPAEIKVEGDWSAAAFPMAAVAVAGGEVEVLGLYLGSRQGDARLSALLVGAGCSVVGSELGVVIRGPATRPLHADLRDTPDLFPALAVVVAVVGGQLSGLAGLATKESDRLEMMTRNLGDLGFSVRRGDDWFACDGGGHPRPATQPLSVAADHRIAMALAVAGCAVPGVAVADRECVAKSWPGFWQEWDSLVKS